LFIGTRNANVYITSSKCISIKKDEEVKVGDVNKLKSIGRDKANIKMVPDSFIDRQNIHLNNIEKDSGELMLWLVLNTIFMTYIPEGKKIGQWCCGKQNKISQAVVKQFPDVIVPIENNYKNSAYNWDGPIHDIIIDESQLENIKDFINLQCCLLFK